MLLVSNWGPRLLAAGSFRRVFGPAMPSTKPLPAAREPVGIPLERRGGRAERHVRDGRALGQEQAREGVPEVVDAKAREFGLLEGPGEVFSYPLSSIKEAVAHAQRGGKILLDVAGSST